MRNRQSKTPLKLWLLCATAAVQAATFTPNLFATTSTWNGGVIWNDPTAWTPTGIPNSTSADVIFSSSHVDPINITSSVLANSLTFTNDTTNYQLNSSAGVTLGGLTSITLASNVGSVDFITLANVSTGSLLFTGTLTINNNITNGGGALIIGPTTVIGTLGTAGITIQGPGLTILENSFAVAGSTVVEGGLNKVGPGLLDDESDGTNLTGAITLNGGTFALDFLLSTAIKVQSSSILQLDGGVLQLVPNSSTSASQAFASTSLLAGHTQIVGKGSSPGTVSLSLAAITRTAGATLDVSPSTGSQVISVSTSTGNTNNLLGTGPAYATVSGGTGWATLSGVVIAPLAGYSVNIFGTGDNTDLTTNNVIGNMFTNSLRFNTGNQTLTLSGNNTLQSGGVLATPSAGNSLITGGNLSAPSSGELLFHVYNFNTLAGLTVNSNLTSTVGLTKAGLGTLVLGGANTGLTGPININTGCLTITTPAAVNSASAINFNDDRTQSQLQSFTIDLGNSATGTITQPIRLSSFAELDFASLPAYGTYFNTGNSINSVVTLSGVLSSAAGLNTPLRFTSSQFTNVNSNQFNLTNSSNSFTGNISLRQGALGINADAVLGNPANTLILDNQDDLFGNTNGGLIFLNSGITINHPISAASTTRIVSNGSDTNTIAVPITGTGGIVKDGSGTLIYSAFNSYTGDTTVSSGTLALGPNANLGNTVNLNIAFNGTFIASSSNTTLLRLNALTLTGGTFRINAGSGNTTVNQIIVGGSGSTIDLTGTTAYNIKFVNPGPAINVFSNATWISPANNSVLNNIDSAVVSINITPSVTLTNGIALTGSFGFDITGGGTLYQNSDFTNEQNLNANIQVTQGTYRVTDISSNSGVGNLGTGHFTLDGGTLSYGGSTASTTKSIQLTTNGGAIAVESLLTNLILPNPINGIAPLTKSGQGTLTLNSFSNEFSSLTINAGTVATNSDSTLGLGPITVNAGATMLYNASTFTSRTFTLNNGTLQAASGITLALNNNIVNGGFLRGAFILGTGASLTSVTTFSNTNITQNGSATLSNFTNGGTLNNNAGLTFSDGVNNFTGTINVNSTMFVQDFGSTGILNINPGATLNNTGSNLTLGGGSRTFIGSKTSPGGTLALFGTTTLEVNGALLVNDGTISGTTDVNFGGQAQGIGTYGPVNVSFGGVFQPGFASSSIPNNGTIVTALSGNGTIDNQTAGGNMLLALTGNSNSTFSGPIQNTTGTLSLSIQDTSSLTLLTTPLPGGGNSTNTYAGGTSIAPGGSLLIGASGALPSGFPVSNNGQFTINANSTSGQITGLGNLSIGSGATLHLALNTPVSQTASLALTGASFLDLTNAKLIVEDTSLSRPADITLLKSKLSTSNIYSATATAINLAAGKTVMVVALSDNAVRLATFPSGSTNFGGTNNVDSSSILLAAVFKGDANMDGVVDIQDLTDVANHWQQSVTDWSQGDFDNSNFVDIQDLTAIANNWQAGVGSGSGQSFSDALSQIGSFKPSIPTPEPASLLLSLTTLPLLLLRRPKKH